MEEDILDALEALGYESLSFDSEHLATICDSDELSEQFMELCVWICSQIKDYCAIEETVTAQKDTFKLDISGFLREMDCPFMELIGIDALDTKSNRLLLLDYLLSELMACRMTGGFQEKENDETSGNPILKPILSIMNGLQMPPPSKDENIFKVFTNIENKVKVVLSKLPPQFLGETLLSKRLNEQQWAQVEKINDILSEEYHVRRQVLLKRIDLTIQSFMWSDKAKKNKNDIIASFEPIRRQIAAGTHVSIADVLASKKDLCKLEKTSSGEAREVTKCDINKIIIGKVPDRGGRPSSEAPPPEMPAFRKRTEAPRGQRADRRGGGKNFNRSGRGGGRGGAQGGGGGNQERGSSAGGGGWRGRGGKGGDRGYDRGEREYGNDKMYYS